MRIILATRSAGKLRELEPMLRQAGFEPVTLADLGVAESPDEDAIEAYDTFEENAQAKARHFLARFPGDVVLADDSGLAVDALGGAPGVRSKRWAMRDGLVGHSLDAANNAKLVASLRGVGDHRARYVAVVAIVSRELMVTARGECAGKIVELPRGDDGFGYDPHFLSDELGITFGEAPRAAKERVSHRGRAVAAALEKLRALQVAQPPSRHTDE
ncbi:MAG: non-canonical purine NTP pyrophosphatase [Gemmatimonadetes bacterium]|nr:non-canonical purine NTP pyrophosphatase [Gemmatimonadota bacterium]